MTDEKMKNTCQHHEKKVNNRVQIMIKMYKLYALDHINYYALCKNKKEIQKIQLDETFEVCFTKLFRCKP